MTAAEVMDVGRDALLVTLMVSGPVMVVALVVGLVVSLFQALTQIQEMTLTFVPKILAIYAALLLFMPFMGRTMASFMARIADRIVSGGG
jgi:flagellar biosynthetic protein FliQ